jgi:glucose-6-phosphate-specific signal transduction histidine kinase
MSSHGVCSVKTASLVTVEDHKRHVTMQRIDVRLALEISDNGKGIEAEAIVDPKFLGLLGMMDRVRPFQGSSSYMEHLAKAQRFQS